MGATRKMNTVIGPESTNPVSSGLSPERLFDGDKIQWGTLKQPASGTYASSAYTEFRYTNSAGRNVLCVVKETVADIESSFSVQRVAGS